MLHGDQLPSPERGRAPSPIFGPCLCQTAGWIKMALGVAVGFGPGHIVLDGDPTPPPQKGGRPPSSFGPFLLWSNGWMHQNATWYGRRPRPRPHCTRWGPSSPPGEKGHSPQIFGPLHGQRAGWLKMPLGLEVGLGVGRFRFWPISVHTLSVHVFSVHPVSVH